MEAYTLIDSSLYSINGEVTKIVNNDTLKLTSQSVRIGDGSQLTDKEGNYSFTGLSEDMYKVIVNDGTNNIVEKMIYLDSDSRLNFCIEYADYFPIQIGNKWEYSFIREKHSVGDYVNISIKEFEGEKKWEIVEMLKTENSTILTIREVVNGIDLRLVSRLPDPITYDTLGVVTDTVFFSIEIRKDDTLIINDENTFFQNLSAKKYCPVMVYGEVLTYEFGSSSIYKNLKLSVNVGITDFYYHAGSAHHGNTARLKLKDYYLIR
jgi:hypothetical protein